MNQGAVARRRCHRHRDASEASRDGRRMRSSPRLFELLALALGVLAAVMTGLALVPLARQARSKARSGPELIPDRAVLTRAAEALTGVQARATRDGWTDDMVSEALSAMRLVAAAAIGRTVSQRPLPRDGQVPEGRLLVLSETVRTAAVDRVERSPGRGRPIGGSQRSVDDRDPRHSARRLQTGSRTHCRALIVRSPSREAAYADEAGAHAIWRCREVAGERSWWNRLRRGSGARDMQWERP